MKGKGDNAGWGQSFGPKDTNNDFMWIPWS